MTLLELLGTDPSKLQWSCADETVRGMSVLEIARPGLRLGEEVVPREVFHQWLFDGASRALTAHIGIGGLEDHEAEWLAQALAMVGIEPSFDEDPEVARGFVLMTLASVNTFAAIRHDRRELGAMYSWASRALQWSHKRVLRDRYCAIDPVTLNAELVEVHRMLAEHQGTSTQDAVDTERAAQLRGLLDAIVVTLRGRE